MTTLEYYPTPNGSDRWIITYAQVGRKNKIRVAYNWTQAQYYASLAR